MTDTRLARERYHELIAADGARLLALAATTDPATPVPTCPGWSVRDLVLHVAEVYEHKIEAIRLRGPRPEPWPPRWPADRDPLAWYADALDRLLSTVREVGPEAPSWTWWPPEQTAGFWSRRMAHETAVHRVDVESVTGSLTPVAADLAVDGIAEVVSQMLEGDWSELPQPGSTGRVGLPGWRVVMSPTDVEVTPSNGLPPLGGGDDEVDVRVRAEPSDLDLWLWGRLPDGVVTIDGDRQTVQRFRERMAIATE